MQNVKVPVNRCVKWGGALFSRQKRRPAAHRNMTHHEQVRNVQYACRSTHTIVVELASKYFNVAATSFTTNNHQSMVSGIDRRGAYGYQSNPLKCLTMIGWCPDIHFEEFTPHSIVRARLASAMCAEVPLTTCKVGLIDRVR